MTPRLVTFVVYGSPQPKGSARAFVPLSWAKAAVAAKRQPRAVITHDNPDAKRWMLLIAERAQSHAGDGQFVGPVVVDAVFHLVRPKSVRRPEHVTRPDIDKLARCVLDALTGILYADDAQIVELRARKRYADAGCAPCVELSLSSYAPANGRRLLAGDSGD